jgi:methyl-accepting chemotaxis protein
METGHSPRESLFSNIRTAPRLVIGFSVVTLLMVGVGVLGVRAADGAHQELRHTYEQGLLRQQYLTEVTLEFKDAQGGLDLDTAPEDLRTELAEDDAELDEAWRQYRSYDMTGRQELADTFDAFWATFRERRDSTVVPLLLAGRYEAFHQAKHALLDETDDADDALEELMVIEKGTAARSLARSEAANRTARLVIISGMALAAVVSILLALAIARHIARPLRRTVTVLRGVADGRLDLRLPVDGNDEIAEMGAALNTALERLSEAMARIGQEAGRLTESAGQLSGTSARMTTSAARSSDEVARAADSAREVSGNVEAVVAGATQLSESIQEIASNAEVAAAVAGQAVEFARNTNETIAKLGAASDEIGSVLKVINSLAEQTNLLALNATIEAARAGESGKGFAVVASEVKELAQETSKATEGIAARVEAIQTNTAAAVAAIGQVTDIISQIDATQATIASAVDEQSATTGEISRNIQNAAAGAGQISNGLTGVVDSTTNVTGDARHAADSSVKLARVAEDLNRLIGQFRY